MEAAPGFANIHECLRTWGLSSPTFASQRIPELMEKPLRDPLCTMRGELRGDTGGTGVAFAQLFTGLLLGVVWPGNHPKLWLLQMCCSAGLAGVGFPVPSRGAGI